MFSKYVADHVFYYHGKYWYKNIKYIPTYFRELRKLHKYGYDSYASFEFYNWFIYIISGTLKGLSDYRNSYPSEFIEYNTEEEPDKGLEVWQNTLKEMIELCNNMSECHYDDVYSEESYKKRVEARDKFFDLMKKYFYDLWD